MHRSPSRLMRAVPLVVALTLLPVGTVAAHEGIAGDPSAAQQVTISRIAGADRYAVAAAISKASFAPGVTTVFVATGEKFPDALAGGPAAHRANAPILLVTASSIPAATATELKRLAPRRVVVLGGPATVSDGVLAKLGAYAADGSATRLSGVDRYATAAAISKATFSAGVPVVYVATGRTFPDALSAGPAAAHGGGPVLLVDTSRIPAATATELKRLKPGRIVIAGGPASVSNAVRDALRAYTAGDVVRHSGATRFSTSAAISNRAFKRGEVSTVYVATGLNFPDALAGVPLAARSGSPLLLVSGTSLTPEVSAELVRLSPSRVVILGGTASVSDALTGPLRGAAGDVPALPACTYEDVLTRYRAYADWWRTLLDTKYMLPSSYHPGDLVDTAQAGLNGGYLVRRIVIDDLKAMAAAAQAAGARLQVQSGFRSFSQQKATFDYWVSVVGYQRALQVSARAGHSEHQLGTALDFKSWGGPNPWDLTDWATTPAGAWMRDNAWRYGFVMSYPKGSAATTCYDYEPWHYRYVGREAAAVIQALKMPPRVYVWRLNNR